MEADPVVDVGDKVVDDVGGLVDDDFALADEGGHFKGGASERSVILLVEGWLDLMVGERAVLVNIAVDCRSLSLAECMK